MVKIIKSSDTRDLEDRMDSKLTGESEDMDVDDQVEVIRHKYELAKSATPNYIILRCELEKYDVSLPRNPDVVDLSEINKKYAIAQSNLTRISNIEINAIANVNNWSTAKIRIIELIDAQTSKLLVSKKTMRLSNAALQQAYVRNRLSKPYELLSHIQQKESSAKAFLNLVESKKKDLSSTITNLSRQVKVISLENSITR